MMGLCPFHDEKSPSFTVSPAKGIYKCFGCGKSGTAVGFIMEHEGVSYPEALKYLANKYNITVEEKEVSLDERKALQVADSLYIINQFASEYFIDKLWNSSEGKSVGLSYFKERGFLDHTIKRWQLGFALKDGKDFTRTALEKQFNKELLQQIGLMSQSEYDFFRGRVMFPIHNLGGKIIAFAGRILTSDKSQPKYINSPESEIYNKRKILFGIYHAKAEIRKQDECIIVEGYTDVMTLHQGGVENAVASSGTSLTVEQIRLVRRFTNNIKIIYDGDSAGVKAALRGLDLVLSEGMNVRLVLLPKDEDPDSFFKKSGKEEFSNYLKKEEKDFILFKIELLLKEAGNDPIKKSEVLQDIVSSIAKIPDALKQQVYINECSTLLNIDEKILANEIKKAWDKNRKEAYNEAERDRIRNNRREEQNAPIIDYDTESDSFTLAPSIIHNPDETQERDLIRLLITGCDIVIDIEANLTVPQVMLPQVEEFLPYIDNELYRKVLEFGLARVNNKESISLNDFLHSEDSSIRQLAVDVSILKYVFANWEAKGVYLQTQLKPELNFHSDTKESILRFKLKKLKRDIDHVKKTLENTKDDERHIDIAVMQKLMTERNEISKELTQILLS
jgi:DNA primase